MVDTATEDLSKDDTLGWLPVKILLEYSSMCKQWNSLFSSTKFLTNHWAIHLPIGNHGLFCEIT